MHFNLRTISAFRKIYIRITCDSQRIATNEFWIEYSCVSSQYLARRSTTVRSSFACASHDYLSRLISKHKNEMDSIFIRVRCLSLVLQTAI
jgi:hypothetical protein